MSCESSAVLFDPCLQDSQGALRHQSACRYCPPALFILIYFVVVHGWRLHHNLDSFPFLHSLPPPLPSAALLSFQPASLTQLALHYISEKLLLNTKPQQSRTKQPAEYYRTALMCTITLTATIFLYKKWVRWCSHKEDSQQLGSEISWNIYLQMYAGNRTPSLWGKGGLLIQP